MKSEPDVYSIDQLETDQTTWWEGVRNYQARNYMMKDMKEGDQVLFYHSNAQPPGVAGLAVISKIAEPDKLQFDKKSDYYDPKAHAEKPIWFCVQVKYQKKFSNLVSLQNLREHIGLKEMLVLQKGARLSVQPVDKSHFEIIKEMGGI